MNRRDRRKMEKQLGITAYRKKMTQAERFEIMSQNIEQGKKIQEEMKNTRRVQSQGKADEEAANRISYIATYLMINKEVPYVEAYAQAKELYKQEVEAANKDDKI